jgi:hypothetical protein
MYPRFAHGGEFCGVAERNARGEGLGCGSLVEFMLSIVTPRVQSLALKNGKYTMEDSFSILRSRDLESGI